MPILVKMTLSHIWLLDTKMYLGEPQSFADNTRKVSEMVVR